MGSVPFYKVLICRALRPISRLGENLQVGKIKRANSQAASRVLSLKNRFQRVFAAQIARVFLQKIVRKLLAPRKSRVLSPKNCAQKKCAQRKLRVFSPKFHAQRVSAPQIARVFAEKSCSKSFESANRAQCSQILKDKALNGSQKFDKSKIENVTKIFAMGIEKSSFVNENANLSLSHQF